MARGPSLCTGWNHTTCPRLSTIIGPPCPGPLFLGATKTYPGAVSCDCFATSTARGLRSGRVRKLHASRCGASGEPSTSTGSGCASEVVLEGVALEAGLASLQPGVFVNAIHAAPALTAVRNLRRVNLLRIATLSPIKRTSQTSAYLLQLVNY